ncbi:DUF397 domain-containing protein [Actinomadura violacea]|uniref:DUF397 domain-containing protein n=1 Tax=Actinomadura violacea TaxID=2819934 RepID=A0ABS3RXU3_9ACTN|nr:DUF397 domain-containing protein [Actinomadura violacea]MBO2461565.1 DUF397 domain-containing protein [Actinomadura violacea]
MSAGTQRPVWRKSSHSSDPDMACCVELAATGDGVRAIRDSVDPDGPRLTMPVAALRSLIETVKAH